jgi:formylglycine-generating enzyme required for sulfatase activity
VPAETAPVVEEKSSAEPASGPPEEEFRRILRLSEVNMGSATESVRRLLANIATNLGITVEIAEDVLDEYLDQEELALCQKRAAGPKRPVPAVPAAAAPPSPTQPIRIIIPKTEPGRLPPEFINPVGGAMVPIPAGEFVMGSDAEDAAPNEQPLTPVRLSRFFMSKHPVTNAQYERFDPGHRQKRMPGAGDNHPVVYVTAVDANKFTEWLCGRDGRSYRLPTEAEWEYAARGGDGRKYPWGNQDRRSDLANFADASTTFPWRETRLSDGYAESSPVGAFPRGASPFGIHDMAGNVWEWCLDYFRPLPGTPKQNPRAGGSSGGKQVHRGGSWKSRFSNLRTTARAGNAPGYCCNDVGFRIVCEPERGESR